MKKSILLSLLAVSLIFLACSGSKSFSKKAAKLEAAGLTEEAADFYFQALQRNLKNVDAKIGLKKTGQKIIENKLNEFYKLHSVDNHKAAVYQYKDITAYKDKCAAFVKLDISGYYEDYYKKSLVKYLDTQYKEGENLIYSEDYENADKVFKEIVQLDSKFKDAKEMSSITTAEPLYRKGVAAFEAEKYKTAYDYMDQVLKAKPEYKDALDIKNNALELGVITIAVMPFKDQHGKVTSMSQSLQADMTQALVKTNDPFLKIIDRKNTDVLLKEQKLSAEGVVSQSTSIQAGELLGAKVLITGKLVNYRKSGGRVSSSKKQGFEAVKSTKVNPQTKKKYAVTSYKRVSYTEYSGESSVYCSFQYQMVSAETGEILRSDVIEYTANDRVNYASYSGNKKALYAGVYKNTFGPLVQGEKVYSSYRDKQQLNAKLNSSKRNLASFAQLEGKVSKKISSKVYTQILSYNPDK